MLWSQLFPIVNEQAYWSILRYDPRREEKIQELVAMSFEKYQRDVAAGKEIKKQDYKCFVTQRAKQVDTRSVCKKGLGGTSTIDVLSFYRRRPGSPTPVFQYDEIITAKASIKSKQLVDDSLAFQVDYPEFLLKLTAIQKRILDYLIQGYRTSKIAEMTRTSSIKVREVIKQLQKCFVKFFEIDVQCA